MTDKVEYINKRELLDYMEHTIIYDDIKDKKEQYDTSTYKNTKLYDFIKSMDSIRRI